MINTAKHPIVSISFAWVTLVWQGVLDRLPVVGLRRRVRRRMED